MKKTSKQSPPTPALKKPVQASTIDPLVRNVLTARVYEVATKTPLERADKLSASLGHDVYLKREDLQTVHSFKLRGAYNKICRLTQEERVRGVIAASAGNHAQGVALAAQKLGISALIIMPRTTPAIKTEAVKQYGAEIELYGDNYSEAAEYCKQRVAATGRTYIHPFDDPLVIAGQGTIGREIVEQLPVITHIFVPVGGGGLIAGIAAYVKAIRPEVQVISVEPVDSACMATSVRENSRIELPSVGIFADGVAVKQPGENTFALVQKHVDRCTTVTTDEICAAVKDIYEATRSIVEPSGALAVAGIKAAGLPPSAKAVAICSGANVTFERLQQIAERTMIGSGNEALLLVSMPERPGSLSRFCTALIGDRSITEFSYRLQARNHADVLVGIHVRDADDRRQLMRQIISGGYECLDISDDDVAKEHLRYMVGGASSSVRDEVLYNVTFPERPRALRDFLVSLADKWNISLFHYRSAASDSASVLIGFEAADPHMLEQSLQRTGFSYQPIPNTPALKIVSKGKH